MSRHSWPVESKTDNGTMTCEHCGLLRRLRPTDAGPRMQYLVEGAGWQDSSPSCIEREKAEKPGRPAKPPVELPGEVQEFIDRAIALLRQDIVSEADRLLAAECRELAKELRLLAYARAAGKGSEP